MTEVSWIYVCTNQSVQRACGHVYLRSGIVPLGPASGSRLQVPLVVEQALRGSFIYFKLLLKFENSTDSESESEIL